MARAREQQRGARRGRDAEAIGVAQRVRAAGQPRDEPRQAAEQAQAGADVGDDRIGRREARHRRERQRPGGELRERAGFGVDVAIAQHEIGRERQRAGDRAGRRGCRVARGGVGRDDARIVAAAADDERTLRVAAMRTREDVERQRRESSRPRPRSARCVHPPEVAELPSDRPSSASSRARRWASLAQKNSSSCGGVTGVPASIACACPR